MNAGAMAEWLGYGWGVLQRETWDRFRIWWLYRVCKSFKRGATNGRYPEGFD